jgi:hypothetical protein
MQTTYLDRRSDVSSRILSTGLLAGLLMNVFGWRGSSFAATRVRTIWHELASLVPDFVYGLAFAWLFVVLARAFAPSRRVAYTAACVLWLVAIATPLLGTATSGLMPWRVTLLTLGLALAIMLPLSELIWYRLGVPAARVSPGA